MKQLFVRSGKVYLEEIQPPPLDERGILVEISAAAISVGTEIKSVQGVPRNPFLRLRSKQFRGRLLELWRAGALWKTAAMKLPKSSPGSPPRQFYGAPTGYSSSGKVISIGEMVHDVEIGERVACAGAPHAQIIYSPQNLFTHVPENVDDDEASFVALGSIALHAVRQAQIEMGASVLIMGLGMIGQLVEQLARSNGARTIATDFVEQRVILARKLGCHIALSKPNIELKEAALSFTSGYGIDVVLLCMGGDSPRPIEQALEVMRDRGRLVIVGTPRMEIPRELFYRKEVELRIARSYGPGRYDRSYEEYGQDYPIGYVRWTEKRNMEEFLRLVSEKRVDVRSLITHRFPFEQAPQAYELAAKNIQSTLGIVLTRDQLTTENELPKPILTQKTIRVAMIGAGSFARTVHLPNIMRSPELSLQSVIAQHEYSAKTAAKEFGAENYGTDFAETLENSSIDLVVIATPHHLHAQQTIKALHMGKAVFCEKPVGITLEEVNRVAQATLETSGFYAVGFNRRFAPTIHRAMELMARHKGPLVLNYRVMSPFISANHWVYDPVAGAGRIIGEACHFFDLLNFLIGAQPVTIQANGGTLSHPDTQLDDNFSCVMIYPDGSIASLIFGDLGHAQLPKEHLEIFSAEGVLVIDDFRELRVHGFSGQRGIKFSQVDKGHLTQLQEISSALIHGLPSPVPILAGEAAMRCCFEVVRQLQAGRFIGN